MRKAANILLRDIMLDRKGRISREFESILSDEDVALIKQQFTGRRMNRTMTLTSLWIRSAHW